MWLFCLRSEYTVMSYQNVIGKLFSLVTLSSITIIIIIAAVVVTTTIILF